MRKRSYGRKKKRSYSKKITKRRSTKRLRRKSPLNPNYYYERIKVSGGITSQLNGGAYGQVSNVIQAGIGAFPQGTNYSFQPRLSDIVGTVFAGNIYDQFKFKKIAIKFIPRLTSTTMTSANGTGPVNGQAFPNKQPLT